MSDVGQLSASDPERIGAYRLLGVLGTGGQGTVYLGEGPSGERVAVKVLHARMAADAAAMRRFEHEAAPLRQVAAFGAATVLETGLSEGRPYLVSDYVPGLSLHELVATDGPRAGSGLRRLAVATVTALEAVHRAGIVHRDFKPANVIMGPEGPVVVDYGIARVLEAVATASAPVGTPAYLAPEQLAGQPAGQASDLFSWAATMVYAATGHPPFSGEDTAAVVSAVLGREPDLEGVPDPLRPLLAACLAKDPRGRPGPGDVLAVLTGRTPATEPPRPAGSPLPPFAPPSAPPPAPLFVSPSAPPPGAPLAGPPAGFAGPPVPRFGSPADPPPGAPLAGPPAVGLAGPPAPGEATSPFPRFAADGRPAGGPASGAFGASGPSGAQDVTPFGDRPPGTAPPRAFLRRGRAGWIAAATVCVALVVLGAIFRPWSSASGPVTGAGQRPTVALGEMGRHTNDVSAVAVGQVGGRPVAVTGSLDLTVRVWDLTTRKPIGEPRVGHTDTVLAVAVGEVDGRPVAVTGSADDTVRVWDLTTRTPVGEAMTGHRDDVDAVAVGQVDGRPVAVTGSADDTVRVWNLTTRVSIGKPMTGHSDDVYAVAVGQVDGRPVAVTGSADKMVRMWDLSSRTPVGDPMVGHIDAVVGVAIGQVGGRPVAVTGSWDKTVQVWDLATRSSVGDPMTGHTDSVAVVTVGQVGGRPVALTGSWDKTTRVWDLTTRTPVGQPLTGHTSTVFGVAVAQVGGRPIAVTGSRDTAVRLWDLSGYTP